jgi:hypothetical protein
MKKVIIPVVVLVILLAAGIFTGRLFLNKQSQANFELWEREILKQLENQEFHKPVDIPIEVQEEMKNSCRDFFSATLNYGENGLTQILARPEWENYREQVDSLKKLVDYIAEVTIGEPFYVEAFPDNIYVPYKLRFKNGHVKEWQVGIRYYDENGKVLSSWYIDGGI